MGIYRKIEIAMWGDQKFCALTPMQPSGQALWIYLLTGPHTNSIPGLFKAGPASIAEELGWSGEQFAIPFGELLREGLIKADTKARLIWLPNALKHNPPPNVNVVKGWENSIQFLPQCELLEEALAYMDKELKCIGKGFHQGLGEWYAKRYAKPSSKQYANTVNSKQDQLTGEDILSGKPDGASFHWEVLDYLNLKAGRQYKRVHAHANRIKARIKEGYSLEDFKTVIDFKVSEWMGKDDFEQYLRPETIFGTKFDSYLAQSKAKSEPTAQGNFAPVDSGDTDEFREMLAAVGARGNYASGN